LKGDVLFTLKDVGQSKLSNDKLCYEHNIVTKHCLTGSEPLAYVLQSYVRNINLHHMCYSHMYVI
jgi:hypothetical protein